MLGDDVVVVVVVDAICGELEAADATDDTEMDMEDWLQADTSIWQGLVLGGEEANVGL